jgi:hypothetical protein
MIKGYFHVIRIQRRSTYWRMFLTFFSLLRYGNKGLDGISIGIGTRTSALEENDGSKELVTEDRGLVVV